MIKTTQTPLHFVIAEHGAWKVFFAALTAILTARASKAPHVDSLPDHIRQDIGLPPRGSPLPEAPMLPLRW
jgi:hypothetical protein